MAMKDSLRYASVVCFSVLRGEGGGALLRFFVSHLLESHFPTCGLKEERGDSCTPRRHAGAQAEYHKSHALFCLSLSSTNAEYIRRVFGLCARALWERAVGRGKDDKLHFQRCSVDISLHCGHFDFPFPFPRGLLLSGYNLGICSLLEIVKR